MPEYNQIIEEKGLEPLAKLIFAQGDEDPEKVAVKYVTKAKKVKDAEEKKDKDAEKKKTKDAKEKMLILLRAL